MTNSELYARILRLSHMADRPSMTAGHIADMDQIVREVVLTDRALVWC